jgi:hypothetical protein
MMTVIGNVMRRKMIVMSNTNNISLVEFKSPQTGTVYHKVNTDNNLFVSYYKISSSPEVFRVRIQGSSVDQLKMVRDNLSNKYAWYDGKIKDGDHVSIDVSAKYLGNVIGDAVRAIMCYAHGQSVSPETAEEGTTVASPALDYKAYGEEADEEGATVCSDCLDTDCMLNPKHEG